MHAEDTTALFTPGTLVHFVYRIPDTGAVPGDRHPRRYDPEMIERVARVREVRPDGLGFRGECLRRCAEGETHYDRTFLFERMHGAREWDGEAIRTMGGLTVVPAFSRVIAKIRETNPDLAARLQAQADRVSAERQQEREAETARETREAMTAAGIDWAAAERDRRREEGRATKAAELNAMRDRRAAADARIRADRAAKIAAGLVPTGAWGK